MDMMSSSKNKGIAGVIAVITLVTGFATFKMNAATPSRIEIASPGKNTPSALPTPTRNSPLPNPSHDPNSAPNLASKQTLESPRKSAESLAAQSAQDPPEETVVHVAGAVKHPGLYHLKTSARNDDAVKAAGGATSGANLNAINLAARLQDGEQLYIPTKEEQASGGASDGVAPTSPVTGKSGVLKTLTPGKKPVAKSSKKGGGKAGKLTDPAQGKVNLNTASLEDLQKLPGIGPAMAERVIEWRKENGGFQNAEDLMNVSGIGEKKFAKMQPFIVVSAGGKGKKALRIVIRATVVDPLIFPLKRKMKRASRVRTSEP